MIHSWAHLAIWQNFISGFFQSLICPAKSVHTKTCIFLELWKQEEDKTGVGWLCLSLALALPIVGFPCLLPYQSQSMGTSHHCLSKISLGCYSHQLDGTAINNLLDGTAINNECL